MYKDSTNFRDAHRGGGIQWYGGGRDAKKSRGRYEYRTDDDPGVTVHLRADAQGYQPAVSRSIGAGEGEVVVDFRLARAAKLADIQGVVRLPDGSPLVGAEVHLATQSKRLQLYNGRPDPIGLAPGMRTESGPDGRFSFPAPDERAAVVVLHDFGFAQKDVEILDRAPDLTLEPWARIEGTLRVGGKPGAGESVDLEDSRSILLGAHCQHWGYEAEADARGYFLIERVMPTDSATVERRIPTRLGRLAAIKTPPFAINPGETARVELGGTGRPVVGRLAGPDGAGASADFADTRGTLSLKLPEIPRPVGFEFWDARRQQDFMATYWKSPEGRARRQQARTFAFRVSPDGGFRVEDVPPGDYELVAEVLAHVPPYAATATARRDVAVPEIPGGRSDEPLDLGVARLQPGPGPR